MTRKEAIKEKLELIKLVLSAGVTAIIAITTYNYQVGNNNFIVLLVPVAIFAIFLFVIYSSYKKCLISLEKEV